MLALRIYRTAWFFLPPLKTVASLQAAVGQVGWAGKGSVLSARPPSFPGAGGYFMINLNHDSKAMCRPSEITRRTLGPLDKRKKTTRCQPCANRRVKVWASSTLSQWDEISQTYTIYSATEVTPAKDAYGQRKFVRHSGQSRHEWNSSMPQDMRCLIRFPCKCGSMMMPYI